MGQNRRYGDPLTALDGPAIETPAEPKHRHVWINLSNLNRAPAEFPGVIITWRRTTTGWEAQVAYVTATDARETLHVTWTAADHLRPA